MGKSVEEVGVGGGLECGFGWKKWKEVWFELHCGSPGMEYILDLLPIL